MLTFQKQQDPRVKIEDEIRVKIENDPKTKEIGIRDQAVQNHNQMILDILCIISMLKEIYETKAPPDPSHFGGFSIERVFESLCEGLKFIYSTPELYSEQYRNKSTEMDRWLKDWLYGETVPLFDANTGYPSPVVEELIDYMYRFDSFFVDMKSFDTDDVDKLSLSASVHYDPVYRYQELCDLLGMQVRSLRETQTYNKSDSVEKTIVQMYKPVIHVLHPVNKGQTRGEGWARMRNSASQIVDLLQACQRSCQILEVKYDEDEAVRLSTASSVLMALVAAPINNTNAPSSSTNDDANIGGRFSSSDIEDRMQHIYDLTRSAHDLYARSVPQREEAKQTIIKCIDACNGIVDFKLDPTMFSIIRRSLIVVSESSDITECVMTCRTALREILHLARHHNIKVRVPIVNMRMEVITTRQEEEEKGEANNDIVCQIDDLVDELGESTLDGESDDRVLGDDTRQKIKHTLKYAKKVNKHDEETLRTIKQIKNMLKDNTKQVTDIGDALTQLSLDLSQ